MGGKYTSNFTRGNVVEQLLVFALPFILGNLCMQSYNYIDAIIVGKFLGKEALAAVGASSPFVFVLVSFISGITIGGSIIVSRYFAQNKQEEIRRAVSTISIIVFCIGVIVTSLALLFCDDIIGVLNLPSEVGVIAVNYLYIYMIGMMPTFGYNALTSYLRGVGNSKTPLYFLAITSFLNIVLDIVFVVWYGWGVESVAWATVISQIIGYISLRLYVNHKIKPLSLFFSRVVFCKKIAIEAMKLGVPTSVQQLLVSSGVMTLIFIVSEFGTDVIAAYTVAQKMLILIMVVPINISLALTTFTAQNYSVGQFDRIELALKQTLKIVMVVCFAILILLSMFSTNIISAFSSDPNIINIGKQYLLIIGTTFWIFSVMMIFTGVIRGLGNTVIPMIITLISLWIIKIPIAHYLSQTYNEVGVWLSEPISWVFGAVLSFCYYLYYRNKIKNRIG